MSPRKTGYRCSHCLAAGPEDYWDFYFPLGLWFISPSLLPTPGIHAHASHRCTLNSINETSNFPYITPTPQRAKENISGSPTKSEVSIFRGSIKEYCHLNADFLPPTRCRLGELHGGIRTRLLPGLPRRLDVCSITSFSYNGLLTWFTGQQRIQ